MWIEKARCASIKDNSIFFSGVESKIKKAKAFCAACDVRQECLDFAISNDDFENTIYGGLTGSERAKLVGVS